MAKPAAVAKGIAFAFPDVCQTPAGTTTVPIPYPNIAQLDQADPVSNESEKELKIGGDYVLILDSVVSSSMGDEAGSVGGVKCGGIQGECKCVQASKTVVYGPNKKGLVRFLDQTDQNIVGGTANAQGFVLSAYPQVLVGD